MAENMHKSSGFIPGIRPGENYSKVYWKSTWLRVSIIGGIFAAVIAIFPYYYRGIY